MKIIQHKIGLNRAQYQKLTDVQVSIHWDKIEVKFSPANSMLFAECMYIFVTSHFQTRLLSLKLVSKLRYY